MAFLRIQNKASGRYYLIVASVRRGEKVRQKVLEYLGRDPDPERLGRALEYWGVKRRPVKGGRRKRR